MKKQGREMQFRVQVRYEIQFRNEPGKFTCCIIPQRFRLIGGIIAVFNAETPSRKVAEG